MNKCINEPPCDCSYEGVSIRNFTTSWRDGLAFNALIHKFRPNLFEYKPLLNREPNQRLDHAFQMGKEHLGIVRLLDPEGLYMFSCTRNVCRQSNLDGHINTIGVTNLLWDFTFRTLSNGHTIGFCQNVFSLEYLIITLSIAYKDNAAGICWHTCCSVNMICWHTCDCMCGILTKHVQWVLYVSISRVICLGDMLTYLEHCVCVCVCDMLTKLVEWVLQVSISRVLCQCDMLTYTWSKVVNCSLLLQMWTMNIRTRSLSWCTLCAFSKCFPTQTLWSRTFQRS